MKYIINNTTVYTCKSNNPHDDLREILIEALLDGKTVENTKDEQTA